MNEKYLTHKLVSYNQFWYNQLVLSYAVSSGKKVHSK